MTHDDEHQDLQVVSRPPAPVAEQGLSLARHELVLHAAETVRRLVEEEPR